MSRHKSLLTQACISLMSFIFPFNWKHTLIPILPEEMIDVLDAPLPFLIGVEASVLNEDSCYDDVTVVYLDSNQVVSNEKILETVKMPQKELRTLKEKLMRATTCIK